jgi:serine protease Do/serine protease DegQ
MKPRIGYFKRRTALAAILCICLAAPGAASASLPTVDSQGKTLPSLAPMLQQATPAVVNISTLGQIRVEDNPLLRDPFFRRFFNIPDRPAQRQAQSLGSGVVIDADKGYVLTNHHVIDKAAEITVTLQDGRRLEAKLVGSDAEADIAVIQIPAERLTALPLADSDALRVGDFVVAIGNPFGLGQTVTSGIVSALGRRGLGIEGYEDFIQTDASINPGNSGGALVNLAGELVGINTAILAPGGGNVGIGFAIPSTMARLITQQLVEYGEVRRGYLGITAQDLTPELAQAFGAGSVKGGAVVVKVTEGSPAERSGVRSGDIIAAINSRDVRDAADLRNRVGLMRIGEDVKLDIMRDNHPVAISVVIAEPVLARLKGDDLHPRLAGAIFGQVSEIAPNRDQGVVVLEVESGSPAWRGGLRPGDVIASINRHQVVTLDDLKASLTPRVDALLLNIQRGDLALFIILK